MKDTICNVGIVVAILAVLGAVTYPFTHEIYVLNQCDKVSWRSDLHYGDEVKITKGFFAGNKGVVEAQAWINRAEGCNIHAFKLDVYNNNIGRADLVVDQDELEK